MDIASCIAVIYFLVPWRLEFSIGIQFGLKTDKFSRSIQKCDEDNVYMKSKIWFVFEME